MFFAIAEDDERVLFLSGFLECVDRQLDCLLEVGSAEGCPVFIDLLDRLADGGVVDREGGVNIRAAGEADDADAFIGECFEQFVDRDFCAREAVGFHILDSHAA